MLKVLLDKFQQVLACISGSLPSLYSELQLVRQLKINNEDTISLEAENGVLLDRLACTQPD